MVINFFLASAVVFLISFFLCNLILKFLEKFLFKAQYDSTAKFRYVLSCLITFVLGITVGKIIVGKLI